MLCNVRKKYLIYIQAIVIIIAIYLTNTNKATASAWLIPENKGQLIVQNINLRSNLHGNRYNGDAVPLYLDQSILSLYFEHGITKRISGGFYTSVINRRVDDKVFHENNNITKIDTVSIFGKYYLYKNDFFIISKQETLTIPVQSGYTVHRTQLQYENYRSFETRLMLGLGTSNSGNLVSAILGSSGSFINMEFGYKINTGQKHLYQNISNYDEIKTEVDIGVNLHNDVAKMLLLQYFKTNRIYKSSVIEYGITDNGYGSNDISNIIGSVLFNIGNQTLVQTGVYYETKNNFFGNSQEGNRSRGIVMGLWF